MVSDVADVFNREYDGFIHGFCQNSSGTFTLESSGLLLELLKLRTDYLSQLDVADAVKDVVNFI